ncbi:polyprenyl diphosphate synthase, partial [Candidatus Pelagibacter sp.]|nr:polyprenyl diphosphate synthase [Candidatus Pelagibacter sp.]
MSPVKHVAIIMDGNGRWGLKHKQSRNAGHRAGLNTVDLIINQCIQHKIKFLTLYAFSSENWKRPKNEITFLFKLLENFLIKKINEIIEKNIKIKFIGELSKLPIK